MTIDLTGVATSLLALVVSVGGSVFLAWLQSHMKDQAAAATVGAAVKNALGAVQQAADAGLTAHPLQVKLPAGTSATTAAGVSYVLSQAGPEATRLGITPEAIASKIEAQIGLAKVAATVPVVTAAASVKSAA